MEALLKKILNGEDKKVGIMLKKTDNVREAQIVMESILRDIDIFCKENKLNYWLMGGTLLGAIRHKGFIPWDDDIDIVMPRKDYNKLKKIFRESRFQKKYELLDKDNSKGYPYYFYKVVSKDNFCDYNGTKDNKGIFLDIFPIDFYPVEAKNFLEKLCFNRKRVRELLKKRKEEKNYFKRRKITLEREVFRIKNYFLKRKLKKFQSLNNGKYMFYDLHERFDFFYEYVEIFPLKNLSFEKGEYFGPNNYDIYLKKQFGNYMELPPIEKRKSHHPLGYFYIKENNKMEQIK